jgi:amidase
MCAFALGTETDTSIIYPADRLGLVGFKPSLGLVSCKGVIPESRNFDVLGPLARSVHDAALVMDVIAGDKEVNDTYAAAAAAGSDNRAAFKGARFGMPWTRVWEEASLRVKCAHQYKTLQEVMDKMRGAGAEIVAVDLPSAAEIIPPNGWDW